MIDNKKIEDAAKQHSEESYISDYFQACYKDAFIESAKWTINEFLKDLWHPVSEEPKKGRVFLYKTIFKGYGIMRIELKRMKLSKTDTMQCYPKLEDGLHHPKNMRVLRTLWKVN